MQLVEVKYEREAVEMPIYQKVELVIEQQYGVKIAHKDKYVDYMSSKSHAVLSKYRITRLLDKLMIGAARNMGANADPKNNTVVVNDYMLDRLISNDHGYVNLLLHEVGHVKDYQDRGKFRFWISAISSIPTKIRCSKYTGADRLKMYYSTDIEKKANAYSNLDYRCFIF